MSALTSARCCSAVLCRFLGEPINIREDQHVRTNIAAKAWQEVVVTIPDFAVVTVSFSLTTGTDFNSSRVFIVARALRCRRLVSLVVWRQENLRSANAMFGQSHHPGIRKNYLPGCGCRLLFSSRRPVLGRPSPCCPSAMAPLDTTTTPLPAA